jgi:hypothetical protein
MKLYWRNHVSDGSLVRVWREDWQSDQFQIMTPLELETFEETAKMFSIYVEEAED